MLIPSGRGFAVKVFFSWAHEALSTGPDSGYLEGGAHTGSFLERSLEWAWLHACALSGGVNGRVMGPQGPGHWQSLPALHSRAGLSPPLHLSAGGGRPKGLSPALLTIKAPRQRGASPSPPSSWGWCSLTGLTHGWGGAPGRSLPRPRPFRGAARLCCGCGNALEPVRLPSTLLLCD